MPLHGRAQDHRCDSGTASTEQDHERLHVDWLRADSRTSVPALSMPPMPIGARCGTASVWVFSVRVRGDVWR